MRKVLVGVLMVVMCATIAPTAAAQRFGVQANFSSEVDFGVGARGEFDLTNVFTSQGAFSRAFIIAQFDWFFPDCGGFGGTDIDCTFWELSPILAVPITVKNPRVTPYFGGGLAIAGISREANGTDLGSDTEIGFNLLGGIRFPLGGVSAYTNARVVVGDADHLVLTFGFLFGGK